MRTIGIIQPNYLAWRGYFDFIHEVDAFVFLDDVQFTPRDWRSRNRIKHKSGESRWLSVPVTGGRNQRIDAVRIDNTQRWARKHLEALRHSYGKTPFFAQYLPELEEHFEQGRYSELTTLNRALTEQICEWLGFSPELIDSSTLDIGSEDKEQRLLDIVKAVNGQRYLSGPAAKDYIDPSTWADAGIELAYKDYSGYPTYPQISEPFDPAVTVLDLLFMVGDAAPDYIWGCHRTTLQAQENA